MTTFAWVAAYVAASYLAAYLLARLVARLEPTDRPVARAMFLFAPLGLPVCMLAMVVGVHAADRAVDAAGGVLDRIGL